MTLERTILVVEDDDGLRIAMERFLGAAGFSTVAYLSAEAMFAGGNIERAACVVSDMKLPAMSGLDLLDVVRAHEGWPPVIVMTAHDSQAMRDEAQRHGAAGYLAKPFQGGALLAAIDGAIATVRPSVT